MWTVRLSMMAMIIGVQVLPVTAFYIPGVNPHSFAIGEEVKLKVNKMTSTKTLMPLNYYDFPYCKPKKGPQMDNENLGEFLAGDRIENSPYLLKMQKEMYCEHLCAQNLGRAEQKNMKPSKLVKVIRREYHNNWIVDNLPAASQAEDKDHLTTRYWQGFPVGYIHKESKKAYIHNHVNIEIKFHEDDADPTRFRIVGFFVEPFSISHDIDETTEDTSKLMGGNYLPLRAKIKDPIPSCDTSISYDMREHTSYAMVTEGGREGQLASDRALFTYDVKWVEDEEMKWASRWDIYLNMNGSVPAKVHWVSILNSLVIVVVLSSMIGAILVRNLRRDFARYNKLATDEEKAEDLEEFGWKLVHADVFRPPSSNPMMLAVLCGTGAQLLCMTFWTIIFSWFGFLSPAKRGALVMAELIIYVLMGIVAGYVTARLYKTFKGKEWQKATTMTALLFPGIAFSFFIILNMIAWGYQSTDRVPFTTMLVLIVMWFGISTPLVFAGAYFGYKQDGIEYPVNTSSIPRQIPDQPWFMGAPFSLAVGGILPFGSCFVELYYILASVWMEYYYYVFGFLLMVFFILLITCAEITVLFTYFQLCSENYHWWWRSFSNAGSTAIYVMLYSLVYFQQLEANTFVTYVLYFGYMALVSGGLFCMMGFVGVATSLYFNIVIFASIKID